MKRIRAKVAGAIDYDHADTKRIIRLIKQGKLPRLMFRKYKDGKLERDHRGRLTMSAISTLHHLAPRVGE